MLLAGQADYSNSQGGSSNTKWGTRFQAVASGTATHGRFFTHIGWSAVGDSARVAVYEDSSGTPGSLLAETGLLTGSSFSWLSGVLDTPVSITSGNYYWIAVVETHDYINMSGNSATGRYNSDDPADGASDPFGSGTSWSVGYDYLCQGFKGMKLSEYAHLVLCRFAEVTNYFDLEYGIRAD